MKTTMPAKPKRKFKDLGVADFGNGVTMPIVECLVRDATLAVCDECGIVGTDCDPVPWKVRNTAGMHERGTGHRVRMARYDWLRKTEPVS